MPSKDVYEAPVGKMMYAGAFLKNKIAHKSSSSVNTNKKSKSKVSNENSVSCGSSSDDNVILIKPGLLKKDKTSNNSISDSD